MQALLGNLLTKVRSVPSFIHLLVFTLLVFSFFTPRFLSLMNISNIVLQSCMLIIVSLGMTIVMLSNGIDLSAGSIISLSGVSTGLSLAAGGGLIPSILVGLAVGTACGAVNGFMISKVGLPPFIATFGMLGVADGLSLFFSGGETVYWQEPAFKLIANGHVATVPIPVLIVAALFLILYFILYTTPFGVNVFAIGGNEEALRLSGVNIVLNKTGIYILSGMTASISGQVLASRILSANPTSGFGYEFEAIAAAVIGGTTFFGGKGGISGTVIGALIIGMIQNGLSLLGYTTPVQYCFMGIVLTLGVTLNILIHRKK
jgi:ribose transport system permease protein